jgi:hypothetical protein
MKQRSARQLQTGSGRDEVRLGLHRQIAVNMTLGRLKNGYVRQETSTTIIAKARQAGAASLTAVQQDGGRRRTAISKNDQNSGTLPVPSGPDRTSRPSRWTAGQRVSDEDEQAADRGENSGNGGVIGRCADRPEAGDGAGANLAAIHRSCPSQPWTPWLSAPG